MESAFTYPSLAFGSESTPLGEQLQRYSMFNNKKYLAEKDDKEVTPITDGSNQPPNDGGEVTSPDTKIIDKVDIIPLTLTILAIGLTFWVFTELDSSTLTANIF